MENRSSIELRPKQPLVKVEKKPDIVIRIDEVPEPAERSSKVKTPKVDIYERRDEVVILVDLPGADRNDIDLTVEGDQLVLSPQFKDRGERPGWRSGFNESEMPPFDGDIPNDGEPPFDGERPGQGPNFNDSKMPPFDGERPYNGGRSSMTISYTYSFNENYDILYINGLPFIKN